MKTPEQSGTPELSEDEVKSSYILAAIGELHTRHPERASFTLRDDIAPVASYLDPDYDPRRLFERVLGVSLSVEDEGERRKAYLGSRNRARTLIAGLVEDGKLVSSHIAPVCLEGDADYGRRPNEDGKLYRLAGSPVQPGQIPDVANTTPKAA